MDLLKLSKKAIQHPLYYTNFFVLFVTTFILLIVGLSVAYTLGLATMESRENPDSCNFKQSKKFNGDVSSTNNAIFQLDYKGNASCVLSAFFSWKNSENIDSVWIYNPEGEIEVIEPTNGQSFVDFSKNSPLTTGRYRFVIKADTTSALRYSGNISIK